LWDATTGRRLLALRNPHEGKNPAVFSPDGRLFATGGDEKDSSQDIIVWDAQDGHKVATLSGHTGPISCLAYSLDGQRLVSGSLDGSIKVWDTITGIEILTLRKHAGTVLSVAFSPNGKQLVSQGNDAIAILWSGEDGGSNLEDRWIAWHRQSAENGEQKRRWFVTAFHLSHLIGVAPNDQGLYLRRANAWARLGRWAAAAADVIRAYALKP
jgi:WD40 repeat protein